jgi:hypothetical protein
VGIPAAPEPAPRGMRAGFKGAAGVADLPGWYLAA